MRNTGWYIPYWRKPRKKGKADKASSESSQEITRSDEQLEAVRQRWIERYRRTAHALAVLGLSVGSNRGEVQARYDALRAAGRASSRDLEESYRYLLRVLPPSERRKKRSPAPASTAAAGTATQATIAVLDMQETVSTTEHGEEMSVVANLYVGEVDIAVDRDADASSAPDDASDEPFDAEDGEASEDDAAAWDGEA